jgi:cobyric acid synthase
MRVLHARGAALEREFAYGVLRQAIEPALARLSADDRAVVSAGAAGHASVLLTLRGARQRRGATARAVLVADAGRGGEIAAMPSAGLALRDRCGDTDR